ncbi:MAG: hypothetical protein CFE37_12675 [Alphaproteobacteria bacterium PA4]|nr:MAG: hypothetical protein CFE37_12675 [Alphaproteobacteria bacterium PA4]
MPPMPFRSAPAMKPDALPEVSTFSATFPKFEVLGWIGLFAPTGTPPAAVARLNTEVEKVMQTPELRSHLEAQAMSLRTGSPAQFALMVKSEALRYADIIKRLNIKVD